MKIGSGGPLDDDEQAFELVLDEVTDVLEIETGAADTETGLGCADACGCFGVVVEFADIVEVVLDGNSISRISWFG